MSNEQFYDPSEDTDIQLPVYKRNGKNIILPAFICGARRKEIESKNQERLVLLEFEFQIHEKCSDIKEIDIFHEDENGRYNYRAPKDETVNGSYLVGKTVKSGRNAKLWKNLDKPSGRMNRILLESLSGMGYELQEKEVEKDGNKRKVTVIPELKPEEFLGKAVYIKLGIESFTATNGDNVSFPAVEKMISSAGLFDDVPTIENSLEERPKAQGSSAPADDDPFGYNEDDDDLPF